MQTFRDTGLREALRRRQAAMPPLPDDFDARVLAACERRQRHRNVRRLIVWPSIAAAACVAIAFVLGGGPLGQEEKGSPVAMTKKMGVPADKPVAPAAAGVSPKGEDPASVTQQLVNNKRGHKASPPLRGEEPPAVAGTHDAGSDPAPATQETVAETPPAPATVSGEPDTRHHVFRNRDEMRARIREAFADLRANNNQNIERT